VVEAAPVVARVPQTLLDDLVAWARQGYPNEACGVIAGDAFAADGGRATRFVGTRNADASPFRYRIDAEEQLRAFLEIEDAGEEIWGIFHSHVRSPAVPSPTDVGLAFYPGSLYLICSLSDADAPLVRAWTIEDGEVAEVPLEVVTPD
jgi:proteasome lid subunit RPN8/RPN11